MRLTTCNNTGKRHPRGCRAEFDYTGWSNYNIWRREVKRILAERKGLLSNITAKGRWSDSDSDELLLPLTPRWKERNCWIDCSFPSECHNYRAALLREKALLSTRHSARLQEREEKEREKQEELFKDVYWQEEKGEHEKGELNEEELKSLYLDMVVKGSDEGDIQIQDCDGLGEEGYRLEYTKSKRRKSIEPLVLGDEGIISAGGEPNSPLKEECSEDWGKEEGRVWEDVDLDEEETRGRNKEREPVDEDEQREALRARSMFLRRFDGDDGGEKFGDEDES